MRFEDEIKQTKFIDPNQKAHLNVMFTANWLADRSKQVLKPFGITHQQYNVLRILKGKYPTACAASDIKEVMLDKGPDLTRLIDRLLTKGFVTREVCEENRRKVDIAINEKGLALLEQINPKLESEMQKMEQLDDEQADLLCQLLDKIRS